MHLYIIRHAQSRNNASWLATGSSRYRDSDPELTEVGLQQREYLAKFLKGMQVQFDALGRDPHNLTGFKITHLYCSLMVRSIQTALPVSKALGIPLVAWRDIHETGGIVSGDGENEPYVGLPGKPRSFFSEHYPELIIPDEFGEEGWWNRPFEEIEERRERAKRVVTRLFEEHGGTEDGVAIITHGAFTNFFIREIIKLEERTVWFAMSNTAVTRIDFQKDQWGNMEWMPVIDYTNRLDFLPGHLVTP